jgi:uncharacterized protein YoaH (UPF0181 family)
MARGLSPGEDIVFFAEENEYRPDIRGHRKKIQDPETASRFDGAVHHSQSKLSGNHH